MENKLKLHNVKAAYLNKAGQLMENYFSDFIFDLETIDKMKVNDVVFFIVQPNCTHSATTEDYVQKRDDCAKVWGNYVVFRIERLDGEYYTIKNWDILDKSSYDTKNQVLIQKYKNFTIG